MVNAMYSQQPQHEADDRLDAARALLGVSPNSVTDNTGTLFGDREGKIKALMSASVTFSSDTPSRRDRSDSAGLEALAFLATKEHASLESCLSSSLWAATSSEIETDKALVASAVSSSSSSDDETMPPPPPRRGITRRRSVSNPEGMEKWAPRDQDRLRFVLPSSILEEELAEASAAMKAMQELEGGDLDEATPKGEEEEEEDEEDEANMSQDELLRRARSRLLEDLSEVNLNGEKGILTLPHTLDKYKEVYNKGGRVGIYTPAERAAIIARFHDKRSRRVWNKKIRYNCRKNLADRRMRVKGRFVKRSTEQQARLAASNGIPTIPEDDKFVSPESSEFEESDRDVEMPDVNDPDAGFCPTDDLPFRRVRRHTIT